MLLLLFSCWVTSDSLQPLQHTRLLCSLLSPGVFSDSHPFSWWCYLTISSSVACFFSNPQSVPASGSFPMSRLFALGANVLELQLQHQSFQYSGLISFSIDWFDLLAVQGIICFGISKYLITCFDPSIAVKQCAYSYTILQVSRLWFRGVN